MIYVTENAVAPPNWTAPWVGRRKAYCSYERKYSQAHLREFRAAMDTSQREKSGKARPVSQETRAVGGEPPVCKKAGRCWMQQGRGRGGGCKLEQSEVA